MKLATNATCSPGRPANQRAILATALLTIWLLRPAIGIGAQEAAPHWSDPVNISNTPELPSTSPQIAVDTVGLVHVIWAERANPGERPSADMIFYTRMADGHWTEAADVIAAPSGQALTTDALRADGRGGLITVWHEPGALKVSRSEIERASDARAWKTVTIDGPGAISGADLAIDARDVYHLVYTTSDGSVFYSQSSDLGASWRQPIRAAGVEGASQATSAPDVATDSGGIIYLSWTENEAGTNWGPAGVWFGRSVDGGQTWSNAVRLSQGTGYGAPDLLADAQGNIHALWIGDLSVGGRFYRWSTNRGQDWGKTMEVAPISIRGYAGKGTLLEDSLGQIHAIYAGFGADGEAIRTSSYLDGVWTEPVRISASIPDSQQPSAIIEGGRRVHVVWAEYRKGEIWYGSYDIADAPRGERQTSVTVLQPAATSRPEVAVTATMQQALAGFASAEPTVTASFATAQPVTSSWSPLVFGLIAALAVALVVVIAAVGRRR